MPLGAWVSLKSLFALMFLHPLITLPAYGIMLAAMLLLAVVAYATDRLRRYFYPPQPNEPAPKPRPEGCCGQH